MVDEPDTDPVVRAVRSHRVSSLSLEELAKLEAALDEVLAQQGLSTDDLPGEPRGQDRRAD